MRRKSRKLGEEKHDLEMSKHRHYDKGSSVAADALPLPLVKVFLRIKMVPGLYGY